MESKKQRQIHYTGWIISLLSAAAVLIFVFLFLRGKSQHLVVPEGAVVAYEAQKESMPHEILLKHGNEETHAVRGKVSTPTGRTINGILNTLTTPSGTTAEVTLADGSTVWLNANSRLTYPDRFTGNTREVSLEGEAYFKVTHDARHPFIVKTAHTATRVLGTEFNVRAYTPSDTHITLVEGSVQVSTPQTIRSIVPGEDAHFTGNTFLIAHVDTERYTAWHNDEFYFDNESFLTIAQEIGKWYNVNVVFNSPDKVDTRLFFAAPKNGGINEVIDILNSLGKAKITYHDNQISID